MSSSSALASAFSALSALDVHASESAEKLEASAWDFGGMVRRAPAIVVEPRTAADVVSILRIATDHHLVVAVRGAGHSQSGQCLSAGGISIDMRGLCSVRIDAERSRVEAEGGATWRSIIDAAFAERLIPVGPTLVTDPTIGGTLSVAGIGSESFRIGAQVNNVLWIDVATLDGQVRRCSPDEHRPLFDAVRSGLGQCGVILRAAYPLRKCKARIRSYQLTYRSARGCMDAIELLRREPRAERVLGFLSPNGKNGSSVSLCVGKEFDDEAELDDASIRDGLAYESEEPAQDTPLWSGDGIPGHAFFRAHTGTYWNEGAAPALLNPWVEHLFSTAGVVTATDRLLERPPPAMQMSTSGIIPIAVAGHPAPLFSHPEDDLVVGLGLFARLPASLRMEADILMSDYARRGCEAGGKRYLSGYLDYKSEAAWAEHYGASWPMFRERKAEFDPEGLLNPGLLVWR